MVPAEGGLIFGRRHVVPPRFSPLRTRAAWLTLRGNEAQSLGEFQASHGRSAAGTILLIIPRSSAAFASIISPRSSAPAATPSRRGISGTSEWMDGITGRDKAPNPSGEGVLTLASTQAGFQQAPVFPDRLLLLLSEVHEGAAAFPSPSAEVAAAVPRHLDPAGYFCRISRRRDGARLRS